MRVAKEDESRRDSRTLGRVVRCFGGNQGKSPARSECVRLKCSVLYAAPLVKCNVGAASYLRSARVSLERRM